MVVVTSLCGELIPKRTGDDLVMRSATIRRKGASRVSVRSGQRNVMDQPHYANPTHPSLTIEPKQDPSRQPTIILSARRGIWKRIGWPVARAGAGIAVTMLLCVLLTALGLGATLNGGMVTLGFDPERAQFYTIRADDAHRQSGRGFVPRLSCQPGWRITLLCRWLSDTYIAQAQHPRSSADGGRQLLVPGAFVINVATLLSLAIIAAGAGAVLGQACGEVAVKPFIILGCSVRGRMRTNASKILLARVVARRRTSALPHASARHVAGVCRIQCGNHPELWNNGGNLSAYSSGALLRGVIRSDAYRSPTLGKHKTIPHLFATVIRRLYELSATP